MEVDDDSKFEKNEMFEKIEDNRYRVKKSYEVELKDI